MLFFFLFLILVSLVPLAVYCLILALINRRPQPVLVRGTWDCAGLVFAGSGFLLVAAPAVLKDLYDKILRNVPLTEQKFVEALANIWLQWWGITLGYYLVLVAGIAFLLWTRRHKTIIYNVDVDKLQALLVRTLRPGPVPLAVAGQDHFRDLAQAADGRPASRSVGQILANQNLVEVDSFAPLGNVTLHWHQAGRERRQELEEELARHLDEARLLDNPVATWLMGIAGALFSVIFLLVLGLVLGLYFPPPRRF